MPIKKQPSERPIVIRDTREKQGWSFGGESSFFAGTTCKGLKTGDYSIVGLEKVICIERKGTAAEFFGNLFLSWERFHKELERMRKYPVAVIVLEFDFDDIINWQKITNIPHDTRNKIDKYAFLSRLSQLRIDYPNIQITFVGKYGREATGSLLKKAFEQYGNY
jgi:ERCC4-type nuclease